MAGEDHALSCSELSKKRERLWNGLPVMTGGMGLFSEIFSTKDPFYYSHSPHK